MCSSERLWQRDYLSSNCSDESFEDEQFIRFNECIEYVPKIFKTSRDWNNMMVTTTQFDDDNNAHTNLLLLQSLLLGQLYKLGESSFDEIIDKGLTTLAMI